MRHVVGEFDYGVLFQQEAVVEENIARDDAGGDAAGCDAEGFLPGGVEEGAFVFDAVEVQSVGVLWVIGCVQLDDLVQFAAQLGKESRLGIHVVDHPEARGDGVGQDANDHGDFESGDVLDGDAFTSGDVEARFCQRGTLLVAIVKVVFFEAVPCPDPTTVAFSTC